jgi:hypothetical protein
MLVLPVILFDADIALTAPLPRPGGLKGCGRSRCFGSPSIVAFGNLQPSKYAGERHE